MGEIDAEDPSQWLERRGLFGSASLHFFKYHASEICRDVSQHGVPARSSEEETINIRSASTSVTSSGNLRAGQRDRPLGGPPDVVDFTVQAIRHGSPLSSDPSDVILHQWLVRRAMSAPTNLLYLSGIPTSGVWEEKQAKRSTSAGNRTFSGQFVPGIRYQGKGGQRASRCRRAQTPLARTRHHPHLDAPRPRPRGFSRDLL